MKKEKKGRKEGGLGGVREWKGAGPIGQENTEYLDGKMEWTGNNKNVPENSRQTARFDSYKG